MFGDLSWHAGIPAAFGEQPVTGGNVVLSTRTQALGDSWIVAQDLFFGTELWRLKLPPNFPDSWSSRVSAVHDGQVYATRSGNTNSEYLYALRPPDGSILWRSEDLIDEYGSESPSFAANGDLIVGNRMSLVSSATLVRLPGRSSGAGTSRVPFASATPLAPPLTTTWYTAP